MINTDNCIHVDSKSSLRIVKTSTLMVIIKDITEQIFMKVINFYGSFRENAYCSSS